MAAAKNGDEEAMESLTIEDMDTYSMISQRVENEDVYSIVDSYFMPYGMECDLYNIHGRNPGMQQGTECPYRRQYL